MSRLSWTSGQYETGVDRGVYFAKDGSAEVWNGLTSVQEAPSDLYSKVAYRDGIKIVNCRGEDSFSATVEAYTYPDSLLNRAEFGFSYRVNTTKGYRTHLVYRASAKPSDRSYGYDDASTFSFDISTTPVPIPDAAPSAHLVIDTNQAYPWTVTAFEDILYGNEYAAPRMPSPEEVVSIFEANALLHVTDNGDGTFTVEGPDSAIQMLDPTTFQIDWPSAIFVDADSYQISSL